LLVLWNFNGRGRVDPLFDRLLPTVKILRVEQRLTSFTEATTMGRIESGGTLSHLEINLLPLVGNIM
jgi:hypothetical protein